MDWRICWSREADRGSTRNDTTGTRGRHGPGADRGRGLLAGVSSLWEGSGPIARSVVEEEAAAAGRPSRRHRQRQRRGRRVGCAGPACAIAWPSAAVGLPPAHPSIHLCVAAPLPSPKFLPSFLHSCCCDLSCTPFPSEQGI